MTISGKLSEVFEIYEWDIIFVDCRRIYCYPFFYLFVFILEL